LPKAYFREINEHHNETYNIKISISTWASGMTNPYHIYHMCHIKVQNMIDMTSMIATAPITAKKSHPNRLSESK